MGRDPAPASLAQWLERWTLALENSKDKQLQAAHARLTDLAGRWAAEALMPAADWLAARPAGGLPGASAAALPEGNPAEVAIYDPRLPAGGALAAIGLALTAWGVREWKMSGGRGAYQPTNLAEARLQEPSDAAAAPLREAAAGPVRQVDKVGYPGLGHDRTWRCARNGRAHA